MKRFIHISVWTFLLMNFLCGMSFGVVDLGMGFDSVIPDEKRFEAGMGQSYSLSFDYSPNLSYGPIIRQLTLMGEHDGNNVVLEVNEFLLSFLLRFAGAAYVRCGFGTSKVIRTVGQGNNDTKFLTEFVIGLAKSKQTKIGAPKETSLNTAIFTEIGYKYRPADENYFGVGENVYNLGGLIIRVGIELGF